MTEDPIPVGFRAETLQQIVRLLRSGESCALVGVGSSGKSNVARHLARADVRAEYFGPEAAQTVVVYLNCKPFARRNPAELYAHTLDQLVRAMETHGSGLADQAGAISELWRAAQAEPEALALRNLDRAAGVLEQAGAAHLIFSLDDCDDLFANAPPVLFSDLRALRDNHKVRLVYLTLTRREPAFLRPDMPEYEEFFELLSAPGHTIPVPPYGEADGRLMLRRLATRQVPPRNVTEPEAQRLYQLAGGHAGLLRSLFFATHYNPEMAAASMSVDGWAQLAAHPDIEAECQKIWESLEPEEQSGLRQVVSGNTPGPDGLHRLQRRGLVRPHLDRPVEVFSPLFEKSLAAMLGLRTAEGGLVVEFTGVGRQVRINGTLVTSLIAPEHALLRCLAAYRPAAAPFGELIQAMRQGEQEERSQKLHGDTLRRLEEYLRQLRAKLGPAGQFVMPEGEGYRLG